MIILTVLVLRMDHRKTKETEQQPGTAEPGNMLGCCLNSFHFLWAILSLSTSTVHIQFGAESGAVGHFLLFAIPGLLLLNLKPA